MRLFIFSTLAIGLFLSSCKGKNSTETPKTEDSKSTVSEESKSPATPTSEMEAKIEELKKLPPLTTEQLKAMLPEELLGIKRSSFNTSSMMGYGVGEAEYRKDDSTNIKLNLFDCAGEAGAGMYSLRYWTQMSMQSENDNGYTKTVDFKGKKALETYDKNNNSYSLTYSPTDRLLVTLNGQNTGLDMLKQSANSLNFK